MTRAQLIASYILAKDSNQPSLMPAVFARDALLDMEVNARSISFPPRVTGVDNITDVLVREFCATYENIHTFCLSPPPVTDSSLSWRFKLLKLAISSAFPKTRTSAMLSMCLGTATPSWRS